jgi:hypothetical protein
MTVARELLVAMVGELRADPKLAAELRDLLVAPAPAAPKPEALYLKVSAYAEHAALSKRTIWNLIRLGMPVVGAGRLLRVDVRAADAWRRDQRTIVASALVREARASATRAARKAVTR